MSKNRSIVISSVATCAFAMMSVWYVMAAQSQEGAPSENSPKSGSAEEAPAKIEDNPALKAVPKPGENKPAEESSSKRAATTITTEKLEITPPDYPPIDGEELTARVYVLKNAKVDNIKGVLEEQLSGKVNLSVDARTQSIIVSAYDNNHAKIKALIEQLDRPVANEKLGDDRDDQLEFTRGEHLDIYQLFDPGRQANPKRIEESLARLRDAKTDEAKQSARKALRQFLAQTFVLDMQAREKQAREIEARIATLRQQYEARMKDQERIIDLQLQVLENEAAGLGFPRNSGTESKATNGEMQDLFGSPSVNGTIPTPKVEKLKVEIMNKVSKYVWEEYAKRGVKEGDPQRATESLMKSGHLAFSPDLKRFAFAMPGAKGNHNFTVMTREIETGKPIGSFEVSNPVEAMSAYANGLWGRTAADLKVPANRPKATSMEIMSEDQVKTVAPQTIKQAGSPDAINEYKQLREQYVKAKSDLNRFEGGFNDLIANAKKQKADATLDDVKGSYPKEWDLLERARKDWASAEQLYKTKMKLLDLDLQVAEKTHVAARAKHINLQLLYRQGKAELIEVEHQKALMEATKLDIERAKSLIELFQSIGEE